MKSFIGSFTKKDGTVRKMRFVPISEIPRDVLSSITKGGQASPLGEGHERVYDLDAPGWRTFNHSTVVDTPVEAGEVEALQ